MVVVVLVLEPDFMNVFVFMRHLIVLVFVFVFNVVVIVIVIGVSVRMLLAVVAVLVRVWFVAFHGIGALVSAHFLGPFNLLVVLTSVRFGRLERAGPALLDPPEVPHRDGEGPGREEEDDDGVPDVVEVDRPDPGHRPARHA